MHGMRRINSDSANKIAIKQATFSRQYRRQWNRTRDAKRHSSNQHLYNKKQFWMFFALDGDLL